MAGNSSGLLGLFADSTRKPDAAGPGAKSAKPNPLGLDKKDTDKLATSVTVVFQPPNSTEEIRAAGQEVYIDLDADKPDVMTHLRTDSAGRIVKVSGKSTTPVRLDPSRTFHVIVSAKNLSTAPSPAQGVAAQVKSGKIVVAPHIAVKVTSDGATPISGLACTLTVGANEAKITSSTQGFVVSADRSSGSVTIKTATKLVKLAADQIPIVDLDVTPTPVVRGSKARIFVSTINQMPGTISFKVTEWSYDISHTNPGSSSPSTATVKRSAKEDPANVDKDWQGVLCTSGTAKVKFVTGRTLRDSGDSAVNATVTAIDPVDTKLDISVSSRTGFNASLTENNEKDLKTAIQGLFENLGRHNWDFTASASNAIQFAPQIGLGPNKGCTFISGFKATFISTPRINADLTNAGSAFSAAQDKAYLVKVNGQTLRPAKVIPRNLYDIDTNNAGAIKIKNDATFRTALGLKTTDSFSFTAHCISQTALLAGTRRHESGDPDRSHKANCLKALRALDPGILAEALVQLPGKQLNFLNLITVRNNLVISAAATHNVVDENKSRASQNLEFIPNKQIPGVNVDASDKLIGPAWDPKLNAELR